MKHEEITETIIGCAYTVYNTLGFGFLESVYEKSLIVELTKAGLSVKSQEPINVYYANEVVGDFIADIIVESSVIIELKSIQRLVQVHEVQLVNYLVATHIDIGLLINFSPDGVVIKRKFRQPNSPQQ